MNFLPLKYTIGAFGINYVSQTTINSDGSYDVHLGKYGVKSCGGQFINRIDEKVFELFRDRVQHHGVLIEYRPFGGYQKVTTLHDSLTHCCAKLIDIQLIDDHFDTVQTVIGKIIPYGTSKEQLTDFLRESAKGIIIFGHSMSCRIDDSGLTTEQIHGYSVVDMVDLEKATDEQGKLHVA